MRGQIPFMKFKEKGSICIIISCGIDGRCNEKGRPLSLLPNASLVASSPLFFEKFNNFTLSSIISL